MALPLAAVGKKITAAFVNAIVVRVNRQGLTGLIPSGVSGAGATLAATGTINVAGTSSVTVNGCFTSEFTNYLVVVDVSQNVAGNLTLQMVAAGVPNTTNYDVQQLYASGTATAQGAYASGASSFQLQSGGGTKHKLSIEASNPGITDFTVLDSSFVTYAPSVPTVYNGSVSGGHRQAIAYDGFVLATTTGTISGTIRVYGYNNL